MNNQLELGAFRFRRTYANDLLKLADLLSKRTALNEKARALRNVVQTMNQPFKVAVIGYIKRGKSSLINALIGRDLAVTDTEESTATVNCITYGTGCSCNEFMIHWKNSQPRRQPLHELGSWSGKGAELERRVEGVDFLQFFTDSPLVEQMNIIDTPGVASSSDFHEQIVRQFLNSDNTDALVYVLGTDVRKDDAEILKRFTKIGMQGYAAYNCIGVMHLWDEVYWNETAKSNHAEAWGKVSARAEELRSHLKQELLTVVPVSAPLGLLAAVMPLAFWQDLVHFLKSYDSIQQLRSDLQKREHVWRQSYSALYELWCCAQDVSVPLISFKICLYYLCSQKPDDAIEARDLITQFSGIPTLRDFIDSRFLKRRVVINLRRIRNQVQTIFKEVRIILEKETAFLREELLFFKRIIDTLSDATLKNQAEKRYQSVQGELDSLSASSLMIDELRLESEARVQQMDNAIFLLEEWSEKSRWLTKAEVNNLDNCAKVVLEEPTEKEPDIKQLLKYAGDLAFFPDSNTRVCSQKIRALYSYLQSIQHKWL